MMRRTAIAVICLLLIGLGWWWWRSASPKFSDSELQRLASLRVTGLGRLENDQPQESLEAFQRLADAFPDQPLGYRNLTVARLMILQSLDRSGDAGPWQEAQERAEQAVASLQKVDPDAAATHVLAARIAAKAGKVAVAERHYETALKLASPSTLAPIWFELYQLAKANDTEEQQASATRAIGEAYAAAPRNTAALLEWLMVQAETHDPTIVETIDQARDVLAPLDTTIQQRARVSLLELLENAQQAAEEDDWNGVTRWIRMIVNVTRPEELVRSDLGQLDLNPLEFVVVDFPDAFYERHNLQRAQPSPPIPVRFAADQAPPLPDHSDVLDFTVGDFNLDGLLDLIVLSENQVQVWSRPTVDEAWNVLLSVDLDKPVRSLLAADLDADASVGSSAEGGLKHTADLDLIVFGEQGWTVLENRAADEGHRELVAREIESPAENVRALITGDFDLDGDLDLFVSSDSGVNVWTNRGEFQFEPWKPGALIEAENLRPSQAIAVDWDRDVDLDILVSAADGQPAGYLENLRHSRLRWRPFDESFDALQAADRLAIEDVDGNASWDLLACGPADCQLITTQTPTSGRVVAEAKRSFAPPNSQLLDKLDYDNDGAMDLLISQEGTPVLLRHLGGGEYESQAGLLPEDLASVSTAGSGDVDGDGDLDLMVLRDGQLQILTNDGGNANHWIDVVLLAQQVKGSDAQASGRVNQYGYGSLLELKNGTTYQPRVVDSPVTHFGLGQQEQADVVRIVWTNGVPQNVINPNSDQTITEQQTLKGSCPYLYAWSGDGYAFVTDLLWAAPLGLQTASGEIAPDRPWEYLKIDGDQLSPIGGEYRLQITEELWEAAYFDHVALIAVDHPETVEIFTNEKVGPPALAEPKLYVVPERRIPRTATDSQGRDVLGWVDTEDDHYLKAYEQKFCQGYVSPHYVEIDLGDVESTKHLTLFLTGWIYPTDTSLNVQLAQDPSRPGPRPPYLMAPDGEGGWREVKDFIGFPGGKTKTIAVDLSDISFAGDDYRLRICTSNEIYWDAIFFSADPPAAELVEQPLSLKSADLHYRGVSERIPHPGNGPERYAYDRVVTTPAWPPMEGNFTRFGDVTDLVRETDDHLVVMGTGDEMTLRFAVPEAPLPEGWRRDFVLHCWGWDKDGDLNTIYGETAEPLPFRAMGRYPTAAETVRPDSVPYRQYLEHYQTRRQSSGPFRNSLRRFGGNP